MAKASKAVPNTEARILSSKMPLSMGDSKTSPNMAPRIPQAATVDRIKANKILLNMVNPNPSTDSRKARPAATSKAWTVKIKTSRIHLSTARTVKMDRATPSRNPLSKPRKEASLKPPNMANRSSMQ
jgi:hypothetical protein